MLCCCTIKSLGECFSQSDSHSAHCLFSQNDEGLLSEVPSVCIPAERHE